MLKPKLSVTKILIVSFFYSLSACNNDTKSITHVNTIADSLFHPPDTSGIPHDAYGDMIRYGRDLVLNTAYYIGPNGTKGHYLGNKMNCTNCHLDAGTVPFGLNYFSSHARYPQYRGREDKILTLAERVNNCIERPHNGTPMPLDCKEMIAIVCYIQWIGTGVPTGAHAIGDAASELEYPNKPADLNSGAQVYEQQCAVCHGKNGEGQFNLDSSTYVYPPLWGMSSFERGSSMHRVLKMARFVKANMPRFKSTWNKPLLTDEEAINVSAFVLNDSLHKRPLKNSLISYPNIKVKPIDYDEGPYVDSFSAYQHKYGPYKPIIDYHKKQNLPVVF